MHPNFKLFLGFILAVCAFIAFIMIFSLGSETKFQAVIAMVIFGVPATFLLVSYSNERKKQSIATPAQAKSISNPQQAVPFSAAAATSIPPQPSMQPAATPLTPPQPTKKKPQLPTEGSIIGLEKDTREIVRIPQAARRQGMYVIGKNGTGKTTFLVNLMLQDISEGMGLCFIDPHGDAINDVLRRLPPGRVHDVILLDVLDTAYPFGLNLYECADPSDLELAARSSEQVMHVFEKVWGESSKNPSWGPAMEDLLRNVALTFIQYQGLTLAEVPLVLTEEIARDRVVNKLRSSQLRLFWNQFARRKDKNEYMASTLNKVRAFLSNPIVEHIVGQSHTTVDFRKIMDEGKILLVKLPGRYEDISSLIGAVLIGQLLNAALSRVDTPAEKRRQFNLYVDEYQNFCTPDMATILAESRKFALATTICHQFLDQLDEVNRGATLNAANMVVFRISGQDAEELAKEFDATPPQPEQIGWKPVLAPKRDVIEHLLKSGHSNPEYIKGATLLGALTEAGGMKIDRPNFVQTDNLLLAVRQHRTGKQYQQLMELQHEVKITIQRLNVFFYEVMRDRDPYKPFDQEDFIIILRACEVYDLVKKSPEIVTMLCSPDRAQLDQAKQRIVAGTRGNKKLQPQGDMIIKIVNALRQLTDILAADPIMVDSGQHEPIYDKPRTYADVQNQIATGLANLQPFRAKCKLGHTEVEVQTIPLEAGVNDTALEQRIETIRQQTRTGYCKARAAVEEEIMNRQADLIEPEEKKRRTTEEEVV